MSLENKDIERSRLETKKDDDILYYRNIANQYDKHYQNNLADNSIISIDRNIKSKYPGINTEEINTSFENFRRNKEIRMTSNSEYDLARKYSDTYFYKNEN